MWKEPMTIDKKLTTYGWSWSACLLGPIWYLYQGMIAKGLFLLVIEILTIGLAIPIVAIYTGIKGISDLYERQLHVSSQISIKNP
jgi:hypothetical protein